MEIKQQLSDITSDDDYEVGNDDLVEHLSAIQQFAALAAWALVFGVISGAAGSLHFAGLMAGRGNYALTVLIGVTIYLVIGGIAAAIVSAVRK